ncbi:hypothetical protein [Nocardia sp. CA-135398]|uniref:hypothetical protein n=1 Tax=Nocardia sp. CA-135398 TaxID=3239977 RepID=UPI003D9663C8
MGYVERRAASARSLLPLPRGVAGAPVLMLPPRRDQDAYSDAYNNYGQRLPRNAGSPPVE